MRLQLLWIYLRDKYVYEIILSLIYLSFNLAIKVKVWFQNRRMKFKRSRGSSGKLDKKGNKNSNFYENEDEFYDDNDVDDDEEEEDTIDFQA
jgi:hypothetical protein